MGRARSMYGGDERHMQDFSAEAWGKKNTWRTHTHTRARARTLQYVITFPRLQKSVFINAPQYYLMRILPVSFYVTVRTLSTKNPTWTCLNSNPGLRHKMPTTNHLRHGKTFSYGGKKMGKKTVLVSFLRRISFVFTFICCHHHHHHQSCI